MNAAAIGLMAGVAVLLARAALVDVPTWALAAVAAVLIVRFRVSSTWLVGLGVGVGIVAWLVGG